MQVNNFETRSTTALPPLKSLKNLLRTQIEANVLHPYTKF